MNILYEKVIYKIFFLAAKLIQNNLSIFSYRMSQIIIYRLAVFSLIYYRSWKIYLFFPQSFIHIILHILPLFSKSDKFHISLCCTWKRNFKGLREIVSFHRAKLMFLFRDTRWTVTNRERRAKSGKHLATVHHERTGAKGPPSVSPPR